MKYAVFSAVLRTIDGFRLPFFLSMQGTQSTVAFAMVSPFIEPHTPYHPEMSKTLPAVYHITESYIDHFRPSTGAFPCRCR
jgi:hypothetical protein